MRSRSIHFACISIAPLRAFLRRNCEFTDRYSSSSQHRGDSNALRATYRPERQCLSSRGGIGRLDAIRLRRRDLNRLAGEWISTWPKPNLSGRQVGLPRVSWTFGSCGVGTMGRRQLGLQIRVCVGCELLAQSKFDDRLLSATWEEGEGAAEKCRCEMDQRLHRGETLGDLFAESQTDSRVDRAV